MNVKYLAIIILLSWFTNTVTSQELPKVIPPSPSAMQMQKYGDYPVGHFTGIPEISIPLYTIKEGDIELPITLSYHASGSKPSDPNGFVGMGWSLSCGATISRTIMDEADEAIAYPNPFYTVDELNSFMPYLRDYYLRPWYDYLDNEPDIFSYSIGNNRGKFVLKRDAQRSALLLPYKPIKIEQHIANNGYFKALDENGFEYNFIGTAWADAGVTSGPTSWLINYMVSATDTSNKVSFSYQLGPIETAWKRRDVFIGDDDASSGFIYGSCFPHYESGGIIPQPIENFMQYYYPESNSSDNDISYTGGVPSEVSFRSGKVKFLQNATTKMLEKVEIYNSSNVLLKAIGIVYVQKPTYRTLLKEINFYDKNNQFINKYSFDYNQENSGNLPNAYDASVDYWGYYNGGTVSTGGLMPNWAVYFPAGGLRTLGTNPRQSYENYMKTYVLERINYPTGGKTEFDYEANKYQGGIYGYYGNDVGGLRIKIIKNYTFSDATPEVKTYKYGTWGGTPENGYGIMDFYPGRIEDYCYSQRGYIIQTNGTWESFRRRYYYSEPFINLTPHGSPVVYTQVFEYLGTEQNNTGKIQYDYEYSSPDYTSYETNGTMDGAWNTEILYKRLMKPFKDWLSGQLWGKTYYKNNGGTYTPVSHEESIYEYLPGDTLRGLYLERYVFYSSDGCPNGYNNTSQMDDAVLTYTMYPPQSVYNFGDYFIESGERRLIKTIRYEYENNSWPSMVSNINYEYGSHPHAQPIKKTTYTSKGDSIITTFKYPHDFATVAPYNTLVNSRHIWTPVVEQTQYKNSLSGFLTSTRTNYQDWGNNIIAPSTIETKTGTGNYETRMRFHNYDNRGNVLSVSKENDERFSYIWDYKQSLPTAQSRNASTDQIAYTSFEADGLGGWTMNPGSVIINNYPGITGKNTISGGVQKVVPTGNYVVGFWSIANSWLNGQLVTQTPAKIVGPWRYYEIALTNVSSINVAGDNIDEIRLYPKGAQMTTYTYDPLIGLTSQCDATSRITYYEYDGFGRLKTVRDEYKNILKTFDYQYQKNYNQ